MIELACVPFCWCLKLGSHGEHCVSGLCKLGECGSGQKLHREVGLNSFFCCSASSLRCTYLKLILASENVHNLYSQLVARVFIYERQNKKKKIFIALFYDLLVCLVNLLLMLLTINRNSTLLPSVSY